MAKINKTLQGLIIKLIRCYQLLISSWLGPCCRFTPTCSHYAIEAIKLHGIVKGCGLAVVRIIKCNPLSEGGNDPVHKGCNNKYSKKKLDFN